jgi:NitT/TauT family transport system substrate-binding protein
MVTNRPEVVKKFISALLEGWEAAMEQANEDQVLNEIKKLDKGTNDEIRKKQLASTRILIKPSASIKIGNIDITAWKQTEKIMLTEKQIKNRVHIEKKLIQPQP